MSVGSGDSDIPVVQCKWVRMVDSTMGPNMGRVTLHDKKDCGRPDCPNSSAYHSNAQPLVEMVNVTSSSRV
ncbi:hypothetical protein HYDPIDRAFT_117128, partial [Hydnomerulius pinastri MD-312]